MEWETYWGVFQLVILVAGTLGSLIFGPRVYRSQKARSAAQAASRQRTAADVTALQGELAALKRQTEDQHTAIDALEHWNGQQQAKIADLEQENTRLRAALDEERAERKRLEKQMTELRVDKAKLEGQINAYQQMFEQWLARSVVPDKTVVNAVNDSMC